MKKVINPGVSVNIWIPTKWKSVASVLAFILIDFTVAAIFRCVPYNLKIPTNSCMPFLQAVFEPYPIVLALSGTIIAYLAWSLIEKH